MKRQPRVVWSNGIFLTPQLFGAQERFLEGEVQFRSLLTGFERWGVNEVEIDKTALLNKKFRLTRCSGVMDTGLAFSMPDTEALPALREFDSAFPVGKNTLDVFLAVPERRNGERNVSHEGGPTLRFRIGEETVYDDVNAQEETIEIARPNFQIVFGGESSTGKDLLKIARICRGADQPYELDPNFIPPCLNAACNLHLWDKLLTDLLERMVFVSDRLNKERGQQSELLSDFKDSDIRRFWVLHIVNRALPELRHIHAIRHCHPEELYRFLLRLGGALCTFTEQYKPTDFPEYDHLNLDSCLPPTAVQVDRMLRIVAFRNRRCTPLTLETIELNRHFKGKISKDTLENAALYVAIKSEAAIETAEIQANFKVLGRTTVELATTHAGLQLGQELKAPADCTPKDAYVYFRVLRPSVTVKSTFKSIPGRSTTREDGEKDFVERRLEVWQDIKDNEEIRIAVLNPAIIVAFDVLLVLSEAHGSSVLS